MAMNDKSKKALKTLSVGVVWVYVLSIRIGGNTIFSYANDILVQNRIVEAIDRSFADAMDTIVDNAKLTFHSITGRHDRG